MACSLSLLQPAFFNSSGQLMKELHRPQFPRPPTSISNLKCHAIMPVGQSNGDNSLYEFLSSKMCQVGNQVQLPHCLKRLVCQARCIKNNKNFPRELFSRSQIYINSERPVLLDLGKSECWLLLVMFN